MTSRGTLAEEVVEEAGENLLRRVARQTARGARNGGLKGNNNKNQLLCIFQYRYFYAFTYMNTLPSSHQSYDSVLNVFEKFPTTLTNQKRCLLIQRSRLTVIELRRSEILSRPEYSNSHVYLIVFSRNYIKRIENILFREEPQFEASQKRVGFRG